MFIDAILKTPGMLFTLMLIGFTLGMMITSILDAKASNSEKI